MSVEQIIRIKNIIYNKNLTFFMYRGGGGGDRLMQLVYQYSKKYKNNQIKPTALNLDNNKFGVDYPLILDILATEYPMVTTNVPPELFIYNSLRTKNVNIDTTLSLAEHFLSEPQILRIHKNSNKMFKNRTVLQFLDSKDLFDYAGLLIMFKNKITLDELYAVSNVTTTRMPFCDATHLEEVYSYMKDNNITHVGLFVFKLIHNRDIMKSYTVKDLMSMPKLEQFYKFCDSQHGTWENYADWCNSVTEYKVYKISESLVPERNILNDIYDIDDHEFNAQLYKWHTDNLIMLMQHGVDVSRFVI